MTKTGNCRICKTRTEATLHLKFTNSGSEQFVWICNNCKILNPFNGVLWIKNDTVYEHLTLDQIREIPILIPDPYIRCAVCGGRKAELHHWAPRFIFADECEKWPKDYLCNKHHDMWHKLVTPMMEQSTAGQLIHS